MVAKESEDARKISVDMVKSDVQKILSLPERHEVEVSKQTITTLKKAYEINPDNYEELLAIRGIGPKAVRALALISEIIYGAQPSWDDPAKYSFAHGGKDGYPEPVNRSTYDKSIEILRHAVENAKIGQNEKLQAIKRLNYFIKS